MESHGHCVTGYRAAEHCGAQMDLPAPNETQTSPAAHTSGTDVPMVAMMRWSALLGDDFQTARELYQQGEFHQTQFSKALLPPQSVVRGHGL